MANYMAEVAKLLGVELGESFKITSDTQGDYPGDYQNYYRFTENNCFETSGDGDKWETATVIVLRGILMGGTRIVKLPWKPREGEKYYVPRIAIRPYDRHYCYYWDNSGVDIKRYDMGIVCKTPEEAINMTNRMLAVAKEIRENDKH